MSQPGRVDDGRVYLAVRAAFDPDGPVRPDVVLFVVAGLFAISGTFVVSGVDRGVPFSALLFELFMNVGLAVGVIGGTLYLRRSELPASTWWNVATGYLVGIGFIAFLLLWVSLPGLLEGQSLLSLREEFILFGNLGGIFGFLLGVSWARADHIRQLGEALETSHELVESAKEALWVYRIDPPEPLLANASYERIFGQSLEALREDPMVYYEAIHPDDRELVRTEEKRLFAGEPVEYEIRVNPAEGYRRWVWVEQRPLFKGDEVYAVSGFARDVTGRKQRQRQYEAIFNQTFQFTGLLDPDGTLLEANDAALEFGGIDREDVVGKKVWNTHWFQVSEEIQRRTEEDVAVAAAGEFVRHDLEVRGSDGTAVIDFSIRPVTDENGEVVLLVPEGRDITEIKMHERRLVSLHEATRQLFRAGSHEEAAAIATDTARDVLGLPINAVGFYDPADDVIEFASTTEASIDLFGELPILKRGESLAWRAYDTQTDLLYDDVSAVEGRYNDDTEMRSELILPLEEYGIFIAGSTEPNVFDPRLVSLARLFATNLASALARIDEQRELETRRRELEHQNERLDEFAGIVSHDLRNPVAVAAGSLELHEATGDPEAIERAQDALRRMDELIDDLLDLSRAGDHIDERRPVSLSRIVEECWSNVDTGGAELRADVSQTILADDGRLAQLCENLFRNAVEHGTVNMRSAASRDAGIDDPEIVITVGELADGFYIADNGPGIPPADREAVFEPGVTSIPGGNGFGLSIVQQIVDAHGWTISISDSADGGAQFEITGVESA